MIDIVGWSRDEIRNERNILALSHSLVTRRDENKGSVE